jgi:hypothetical protein
MSTTRSVSERPRVCDGVWGEVRERSENFARVSENQKMSYYIFFIVHFCQHLRTFRYTAAAAAAAAAAYICVFACLNVDMDTRRAEREILRSL